MAKHFTAIVGFVLLGQIPSSAAPSGPAGTEFFEKRIRPVLAERCYECHSHQSKKLKANFYLDSREGMLQGGDLGVALVLGEPEKSRIIEAVRYANPDLQMPPKQQLPPTAIADLIEWIKMGAPWPNEDAPKVAPSDEANLEVKKRQREHWAWQPVRVQQPPVVKDMSRAQNEIDQFVLAKLDEKDLKASTPADRRTLIRRAYFDLIGLPPSVEEVETFVKDKSTEAFAKVVDRLLASPHYGERFGRHWLDVARYGEDQAHSFKPRLYPQGYRYRDWLVRALNNDMPYDRFVMEQIAGDLLEGPERLERLPALGFFALGPVYYGDSKMFDQLDDRIDTLARGFLGLTVACARCHDHKYDPITQKDYYSLAGIFASTEYTEAPLASQQVVDAYNQAHKAIDSKTNEISNLLERETMKLTEGLRFDIGRYMVGAWKLQNQRKTKPETSVDEFAKEQRLHSFVLERWVKYLSSSSTPERRHLARWFEMLASQDAKTDLSKDEAAGEEAGRIAIAFQNLVVSTMKLRNAMDENYAASQALAAEKDKEKLSKPALEKSQAAVLDEILGKDGVLAIPKNQLEKLLPAEAKSKLEELKKEVERLTKDAPPKYPFAHSLHESSKVRDLPVLLRGNPDNAGEEAPRRFLCILAGETAPPFKNGSGRLELARAIADKQNPLTARVMVNRVWQHHFGQGLVRTPSNFGLLGERPTHPELLDYLAGWFVEHSWSIKSLHRFIMLSSTYQLSSKSDSHNETLDAENKYLWRMNRHRLEVEVWRDAMLAVSGTLERTLGGPSDKLASPENRRRTFYASVSRHDLDSLLRLFDFPDPNVTSDQRTVTTVPLQQLFVLNSEFVIRQAKALASRLTALPAESDATRIRHAFMLLYGRLPTDREAKLGLDFLVESKAGIAQPENKGKEPFSWWEQYAQVLLSANEFMYID